MRRAEEGPDPEDLEEEERIKRWGARRPPVRIEQRLLADPGPAELTELIRIMVEQRHEAAAEIRKLRATIMEAETLIYDSAFKLGEAHTEMTRLRMENAALRRALELKS